MTCPRCGAENSPDQETCHQCAYPLKESLLIHGRYRMTKPWIFSSFRAVYQAVDVQEGNKIVSVREFLPTKVNPSEKLVVRGQFEALMNQYKNLKHRNLASIVDYFVEGNYYYVIVEYVNGEDITKYMSSHMLLRNTGYPEELVSHWMLSMCDLFDYFHHSFSQPVHVIDFKPHAVVFRQEDEQLVFIDNGLAKLLAILGPHYLITEDYNAFKRAGGKFETIEWDLFCLGNFMYFLLTGIDLLRIPDIQQQPIQMMREDISPAMAEIVAKAVGQNYKSCYSDVREIRQDLLEKTNRLPLRAFFFYPEFVKIRSSSLTEWHNFLGNTARTNAVGRAPRTPVRLKWTTKMKPSSQFFFSVSKDYLYVTSREGMIYAVEHETGNIAWKFMTRRHLTCPGVANDGVLYFVTPARELLAIQQGTDNYKWHVEYESAAMASPAMYEGILFVPLYNGTIYAVSSDAGNNLTSFKLEGNIISSPIIHKNVMYVTSLNRLMTAIDIESEEKKWQFESDTGFSASPSLSNNILFVGSHDGAAMAVNAENGQVLWNRNFKGAIVQSIRATPENIYFVTQSGDLHALKAKTGESLWKRNLGASSFEYPFCMSFNTIFIIDAENSLLTIDAFSGEIKHKLSMSHPAVSQLIIAHQQLYMVSSTGHLVAFGK